MSTARPVAVEALVEAARAFFVGCGLDCSVRYEPSPHVRADATIALRASSSGGAGSRQRFAVHAMGSVRLAAVLAAAAESSAPALVVAPWIAPAVGMRLRQIGIAYVDSVGNASVRFGTVLIEVSGRPRPGRVSTGSTSEASTSGGSTSGGSASGVSTGSTSGASTSGGGVSTGSTSGGGVSTGSTSGRGSGRLLTPANRRVIEALLSEPALERAPLRELAAAAGVSLGQAHKSVSLLAEAGYHRGRLDPAQRAALSGVLEAIGALGPA